MAVAYLHTDQEHIREYLKLTVYGPREADALARFLAEEACRLKQTASLLARAREFLKERRVLFPAESTLLRLVGEQRKRAREHIVAKLAGSLSPGVVKVLDGLLEVKKGEAISGLQAIKANPAKPSAAAMQDLADKLAAIEATGILDDTVGDTVLRPRLFAAVPRDELEAQVTGLTEWVTGTKGDVFHGLVRRFSHLRQFSPVVLRVLEFFPDAGSDDVPCLEALRVLKEMNTDSKRKLPEDAPTDFIPKRLLPLVVNDGKPDRKAWECALLLKLQEDLRSGNLSIRHSKRFGRFEDYCLPKERWEPLRKSFFPRSGLPADPKDVPDHLTKRLNTAYDLFLKTAPDNSSATVDEHGWHLSTDAAETLDAAAQTRLGDLRRWLTKQMRTTRLPDLLIEVDNDLRFTDHFVPPAQRGGRDAEDVGTLLAVVLAHGCNIGLHTMAQITQGVTSKQLKRVSDW
jgi:hypothetical protein